MSYRYLEDFATADIAFEAEAEDLCALFLSAADATMNTMIEDLESIRPVKSHTIRLRNTDADMLLFDLLQELIYYKDAEQLLLRVRTIHIEEREGHFVLRATAQGETLVPERHAQRADVKAVTLHQFTVMKVDDSWKALVILDV